MMITKAVIQNYKNTNNISYKLFLILCAAIGLSLIYLFKDSCQLDGSLHYLFSKWAIKHHELFVGVWSRPFYTTLYFLPAQLGYTASRVFTVFICLTIALQTYKLARDLNVTNSPLVILLLFLQPSFFLFCADNMTEPVFALIFISALKLHFKGHVKWGMFVASFMITARPEGFFLIPLWLTHSCKELKDTKNLLFNILLLSSGLIIWWGGAYIITGDPLFILHNWPSNWSFDAAVYGKAGLFAYPLRLPEMIGPLLIIPFFYGLFNLLKRRELIEITSSFLLLFIVHTILRAFGLLGSAGYPRYMICVAPAIAIITLVGWNKIAKDCQRGRWRSQALALPGLALSCFIIIFSLCLNYLYADAAEWSRDSVAIAQIHKQFESAPIPITRLISSNPYTYIAFKRDPWENPQFSRNHQRNIELLKKSPVNTLVIWDDKVGPKEYGLTASDFQNAGYTLLKSQSFVLTGHFHTRSFFGYGGPRNQQFYLLTK